MAGGFWAVVSWVGRSLLVEGAWGREGDDGGGEEARAEAPPEREGLGKYFSGAGGVASEPVAAADDGEGTGIPGEFRVTISTGTSGERFNTLLE
jgi:hypothetical protein